MGYKHLDKIIVKHKFFHSTFVSKTKDPCNRGRMSHMSCLCKNVDKKLGWTWNVEKCVHKEYNDVNLGGGKDWRFVIEWCASNVHMESL